MMPESNSEFRAYEKKLENHIIKKRYSALFLEGIKVRVEFGDYDEDDGADISGIRPIYHKLARGVC